jgi:hypothetical protein
MEYPDFDDAEILIEKKRQRYYRDDPVRWVWIFYGLAQATVTMLMAFSVIEGTTVAAVVTAVALIVYVGVNEVIVRPYRSGMRERTKVSIDDIEPDAVQVSEQGNPP